MVDFRSASLAPLLDFTIGAPDGAVIGVIGENGCGNSQLLRLATGLSTPTSGQVVARGTCRYLAAHQRLDLAAGDLLALEHAFSQADAFAQALALAGIERLRAAGATILIASHDSVLLRGICDEVWWLDGGQLRRRGDPSEVLDAYHAHIARKLRIWGESVSQSLSPAMRKGDGRAEIAALETIGASGKATAVLQSGEDAVVRVVVRFKQTVENPVVGMLIRTRVGLEVFGTNTELEGVKIGPCLPDETVRIDFRFRCELCPKVYTLTAASHDPDGTAHDWVDDAVSFTVADSRYTAGVANLRAAVAFQKIAG